MERAKVKGSLLGVAEFYVNMMEDGSRVSRKIGVYNALHAEM